MNEIERLHEALDAMADGLAVIPNFAMCPIRGWVFVPTDDPVSSVMEYDAMHTAFVGLAVQWLYKERGVVMDYDINGPFFKKMVGSMSERFDNVCVCDVRDTLLQVYVKAVLESKRLPRGAQA